MSPDRHATRSPSIALLGSALALTGLAAGLVFHGANPAAATGATTGAAAGSAFGAAPRQSGPELLLADLQTAPKAASGSGLVRLQAQEGFGESLVRVLNLSDNATSVRLDLWSKSGTAPATLRRSLPAHGMATLDLAQDQSLGGGYFAGRLSAGETLGAIANTRWVSGAASAIEAVPAANEFILPLIARTVYSHTTYIHALNAVDNSNSVTMTVFDAEDGSILVETGSALDPEEAYSWDTAHAEQTFGPDIVGTNAPTGGWLGHAWIHGDRPISVMAYGDELEALGSSAYLARPVSAGASTQYLTLVRANYRGDSLIALANASTKRVRATLSYRGAAFSPSGANETFTQELMIAARGAVFVDLSTRGRGSRPAPDLPRGSGPDQGFVGSATITADGPLLAVVQDEQLLAGRVDSVSAYNAFSPDDLGTEFEAIAVRKAVDYQSSLFYVHNPDYKALDLTVELFDMAGAAAGKRSTQVPAGGLARFAVNDFAEFQDGFGKARLRGSGPFTALAGEERDPRGEPEVTRHVVYIRSQGESRVSGVAHLTERGSDLEVALLLSFTFPGATYTAEVRAGVCPSATQVTHRLNPIVEGKSTTLLRDVKVADLTASPHVMVIKSSFRGERDVACGAVEPLHGSEIVDTTLAWPIRLAAGDPIEAPTATPTGVRATDTPTAPAPTTPAPATELPEGGSKVHLPVAYTGR